MTRVIPMIGILTVTQTVYDVSVTVMECQQTSDTILAPVGLSTPHTRCVGFTVDNASVSEVAETDTGQTFALIQPSADDVTLRYQFTRAAEDYPDEMFVHRDNRFTRAAQELIEEAASLAPELSGKARIKAIADATAARFTYGHPEQRYYDGLDEIPVLGCGVTAGSCVDINTYFIASLRAAVFEAGYVTGYFFPQEIAGRCNDMHCWVVTRHDGQYLEWDIAHHLKMGASEVQPALDPKPGCRFAVAHSMGLFIPALNIEEMKLMGEPIWVDAHGKLTDAKVDIRTHPFERAVAAE